MAEFFFYFFIPPPDEQPVHMYAGAHRQTSMEEMNQNTADSN